MDRNEIEAIMLNIKAERKAFHSEGDFQYEFARRINNAKCLRVEKPFRFKNESSPDTRFKCDIFFEDKNTEQKTGIELKYLTAKSSFSINGEGFELFDNSVGGSPFKFIKDIWKLEKMKRENKIDKGFSILLTNKESILAKQSNPAYQNISVHENRILYGKIDFDRYKKDEPIFLTGEYKLHWKQYCELSEKIKFHYLLVEILK